MDPLEKLMEEEAVITILPCSSSLSQMMNKNLRRMQGASKLDLISPKVVLIEWRSIKILLKKITGIDQKKGRGP